MIAASNDIVASAVVSKQNYTTEDLPIDSVRIPGTFLRPRELGRGNTILGGVLQLYSVGYGELRKSQPSCLIQSISTFLQDWFSIK